MNGGTTDQVVPDLPNHKNVDGTDDQRERNLATDRPSARHATADEEVTAITKTEENLKAEIAALENDTEQAIVEVKQTLSRLRARLTDLKHRLAKFEPSTKQQKETRP